VNGIFLQQPPIVPLIQDNDQDYVSIGFHSRVNFDVDAPGDAVDYSLIPGWFPFLFGIVRLSCVKFIAFYVALPPIRYDLQDML